MERRILQDVIVSSKKSIRDIPIPKSHGKEKIEKIESTDAVEIVRQEFDRRGKKSKKLKIYSIIGGVLLVCIGIFGSIEAFAHATIEASLGSESDAISASFNTRSLANASSTAGITDSVISFTKTGSITITATTTKDVETKATGSIVVFNDYSKSTQKLVANTRFANQDGLIYRINQSVTVPGMTTKSGKTTPGSVTVAVTADQAGDKYNIALSDFTIPGFKGEPQYDGFFGRSATTMTGGFSGTRPVISSSDRATTEGSIRSSLAAEIVAEANLSVPAGYILYPNAYRIDYMSLPDTISGNNVSINEQAKLTGFALSEDNLSSALAYSVIKNYDGSPVSIINLSDLNFSTKAVPADGSSQMSFSLSGAAKFVWTLDENSLTTQLAGRPKGDFATVLQGYPHITKASVSFFPFWLSSFPSASAITVATTTNI